MAPDTAPLTEPRHPAIPGPLRSRWAGLALTVAAIVLILLAREEAVRLIDRLGDEIDRARRTRPELRAIFMSGYTALTIGGPIQTGVTLLEKPFSGGRLGEIVRQTLAGA